MNAIDLMAIRAHSLSKAEALGYPVNSSLPMLDETLALRPHVEIVTRALALHSVVAASCGLPAKRSLEWLLQEGLIDRLTLREREFLQGHNLNNLAFQLQSECLWVFSWVLKSIKILDFDHPCEDHLVTLYPDLLRGESSEKWRSANQLRNIAEIVEACDLAYCLHWAVNHALLERKKLPGRLSSPAIIERRRALEWMLGDMEWDAVPLDT